MNRGRSVIISLAVMFTLAAGHALAAGGQAFDSWLQDFRSKAVEEGISRPTVDAALKGLKPLQRVLDLDRKQPEKTMSFARYRQMVVNDERVRKGREMMARHADELAEVERQYGVAPQYVVALWGIETGYGGNTGGFSVIEALATLAWDGRRSAFFAKELLDALRIVDDGHIGIEDMLGSWAGAMGQNQFMPSSFHNFAADGNGDGRKDIWTNLSDVFASTANYLSRSGWQAGERWGREVGIPSGFNRVLIGPDVRKSLEEWSGLGVTLPGGGELPVVSGMTASLVAPDGEGGPVYLAYDNFRTIMKWNRSDYFATSVGILADRIAAP